MIRKESGKRMMSQNLNHPMCKSRHLVLWIPLSGYFSCRKAAGTGRKKKWNIFNIIDLLKGKEESDKPTYLFVENVKNLLSINAGFDFATVLSEMGEAGYDCRWQVLNSKDYGVPQNRERVFIIANLRSEVDEKYYLSEEKTKQLLTRL